MDRLEFDIFAELFKSAYKEGLQLMRENNVSTGLKYRLFTYQNPLELEFNLPTDYEEVEAVPFLLNPHDSDLLILCAVDVSEDDFALFYQVVHSDLSINRSTVDIVDMRRCIRIASEMKQVYRELDDMFIEHFVLRSSVEASLKELFRDFSQSYFLYYDENYTFLLKGVLQAR